MAHYRVKLRGRNFFLDLNGEPTRFGFNATRFVKADSPEEAEKIAIILVHQSHVLQETARYDGVDRPALDILETKKVNFLKYLSKKKEAGFDFQCEDEDWAST